MRPAITPLFLALVALTTTTLPPAPAAAQEAHEIRAVHYALTRLGYNTGEKPEVLELASQSAIDQYAEDMGIDRGFEDVIYHLSKSDPKWTTQWTADTQQAVEYALFQALREPDSAKFSDIRKLYVGEDERFVSACIEVNAKNGAGSYTGYTWHFLKGVYAQVGEKDRFIFIVENLPQYEAYLACELGYVLEVKTG